MLSQLIEDYLSTLSTETIKGHIQSLNKIGKAFDKAGPSGITPDDLKKLEKILLKVRQVMKDEKYSNDEIQVTTKLIGKVATLSSKNPKSRTEKINTELVELGDRLISLAALLSSLVAILIVQSVIEHITKN